jgi:hypothetical protein
VEVNQPQDLRNTTSLKREKSDSNPSDLRRSKRKRKCKSNVSIPASSTCGPLGLWWSPGALVICWGLWCFTPEQEVNQPQDLRNTTSLKREKSDSNPSDLRRSKRKVGAQEGHRYAERPHLCLLALQLR